MKKYNFLSRIFLKNPQLGVLIKFWLYSGISTAIGIGLYYILLDYCDHSVAYCIQYAISVMLLFLLKFVFAQGVRKRSFLPRMLGFFLLYGTSMLIGEKLLAFFVERLHIAPELSLFLTYPVTLAINTLGSRFVVFRDADNRAVCAAKMKHSQLEKDGGANGDGGE